MLQEVPWYMYKAPLCKRRRGGRAGRYAPLHAPARRYRELE
jgi:hypothetical protein